MTRSGVDVDDRLRSQRASARLERRHRGRTRTLHVAVAGLVVVFLTLLALQGWHLWKLRAFAGVDPVCRVLTAERAVAITFDDGPDPAYTPEVLDLLRNVNGQATFFVVGEHAVAYPDLVSRIVSSGNELGSHTWSHQDLAGLSEGRAITEVTHGVAALAGYPATSLLRAPYGEASPATLRAIRQLGLTPVHWSVPLDHFIGDEESPPDLAADAIAARIDPGDIILAHDARDGGIGRDRAVAVLRALLPELRSEGYQLVGVSELLKLGDPVLAAPRWWFWQRGFSCPS